MASIEDSLTFWKHVEELRRVVIRVLLIVAIAMFFSFFFYQQVIDYLVFPFPYTQEVENLSPHSAMIILSPSEGIVTVLKTCFWVGLVISSPLWLYMILQFIIPALHFRTRSLMVPFFFFSLLFAFCGFLFSFFVTIPFANQYFYAFNARLGINCWTLSNYLDYTLVLLLANALAFELCVILLFLVHEGIISAVHMGKKRKAVIVGIFVLAAILTPPDFFTQLMLALPLIGFYEAGIIYARFRTIVMFHRKTRK